MNKEISSLESHNTWDIKDANQAYKPLKTRWVFKQLYGLNYIDTFASVVKQMAWRLIFGLAVLNS